MMYAVCGAVRLPSNFLLPDGTISDECSSVVAAGKSSKTPLLSIDQ
jgi:hypothetical protein